MTDRPGPKASSGLISADGDGRELFPTPAEFFLTHQAQIEEWAGLRSRVNDSLRDWYQKVLSHALAEVADQRDLQLHDLHGPGSHHSLTCSRASSPQSGPVISIGIGWSDNHPLDLFACVRASSEQASDAFMDQTSREELRQAEYKVDRPTWPAYGYIDIPPLWWSDLDGFCAAIVSEVESAIDLFLPKTDAAIASISSDSVDEG